ncbi:MAG: helix-turn-helix domain-containing protein [Eubacteriales bacterium]|nr:helix-turn-helix domain-containing protein [Eubacteriales bacterium]
MRDNPIANYVRTTRKKRKMTQKDLADFSGLSLHFIQNLEQGKESLQLDKVNELLNFFNAELVVKERK